jgi:flagellum-specific peptidoglycan hydrolase FlgJ
VDGELQQVREPFASYESLDAGVDAYLGLLKRRYPRAFQAALSGDADTFVAELKEGGYFTETEESYRKGVAE